MVTDNSADTQNNASDNRDATSEDDIAPWQSSAAEFDNIDEDIIREYEHVNPWGDDFPILSPGTAPAQMPTPAATTKQTTPSAHGHQYQSQWGHPTVGQYSLYSSPYTPSFQGAGGPIHGFPGVTAVTPQTQAWEMVRNPSLGEDQNAHPQLSRHVSNVPQSYSWGMTSTPVTTPHSIVNRGPESAPSDGLHFVSIDPHQQPTSARPQRRGPYQDRERQEETSRTRGLKACVRCRMQKIRVRISLNTTSGSDIDLMT
jgi:hypothetical protein